MPAPKSRVVELPEQNISGPLMVVGIVGNVVVITEAEAVQPFHVTVPVHDEAVFTVIVCVVAPFDQR